MLEESPTAKALFLDAVENYPVEEWAGFLDRACPDDRPLRKTVEQLLEAHRRPDTLLDLGLTVNIAGSGERLVGTAIGRYTLLEELGDGGMGLVYRARQDQPVRREVALKMIKPGMDTRQVIARFEAERQALALMDHPHIARVLDGGAAENGRPYFVMELVRGVPITRFCREQALTVRERLELFVPVCQAVEHAHQKGIIHRDLKPSNVLVARVDGRPIPKVIDFGIAKALHEPLTDRSLCTVASQLLGTPAYMSPEQVSMSEAGVDTRTDVYSLGIVLYEMLAGRTPHDRDALKAADYGAWRRIVCETEPPKPSDRVAQAIERAADGNPDTEAAARSHSALLRGDLDWIILRAIEIDPDQRYQSVAALLADVQRYLRDEPIEASVPSPLYRFRKLVRRRKGTFAAGALVVLSMVAGLVVSTWQAVRATNAEHEAKHRLEEVARQRRLALEAQTTAEHREEDVRRLLYASDMTLASEAWRQNDVSRARQLLARHVPLAGQPDLRGFEWHLLNRQQQVVGKAIAEIGSEIYDVKFSPDDRWLAVTGKEAVIRLFDGATFEPRGTIATGQTETNGLAFSRDSKRLAAAGDDGTVAVWEVATLHELVRFKAHEGVAFQVAFTRDGSKLATCGAGNVVRLWNSTTGASLGTRNKHVKGNVEAVAISPKDAIISAGSDGQVITGPLSKGPIHRKLGHSGSPRIAALALSPEALLAWAQIDGTLHLSMDNDVVDYRLRLPDGCQSLAFSRYKTEHWLAVGDRAGGIRIIPVRSGAWELEAVRQWSAHTGRVYALAVTAERARIIYGGADGRVMLWEPFPPDPAVPAELLEGWHGWDIFSDGRIAIARWDRLYYCDADFRILAQQDARAYKLAAASDAGLVFFSPPDFANSVTRWNPSNGATDTIWERPDAAPMMWNYAVTPDGTSLFVLIKPAAAPNQLLHVDVATKKVVQTVIIDRAANPLAISPNGRWLAFAIDNEICLYDIESASIDHRWNAPRNGHYVFCFSPDSLRLASASGNRAVSIWNHATGELLFEVLAHRQGSYDVTFNPAGDRLATFGADNMVRVWDGRSASPLLEWPCVQSANQQLRFTPDGNRLIGRSELGRFLLLDGTPESGSAASASH